MCFTCGPNSQHCALLGYRANEYQPVAVKYGRVNVKFYLDTSSNSSSFCRECETPKKLACKVCNSFFSEYHYLLQLNLAQPRQAEKWVQGTLQANLYGSDNEVLDLQLTPE